MMTPTLTRGDERLSSFGIGKLALVTGGLGFIGTNLSRELTKRGYVVRVLDYNQDRVLWAEQQGDWEVWYTNILNGDLKKAVDGVDVVFNLATICLQESLKNPELCIETAVQGNMRVLKATHQAQAFFVHISSSEVYGDTKTPIFEESPLKPTTIYGAAKAAGELITEAYCRLHHLRDKYIIVRPFNSYGPESREDENAQIITNFLRNMILGKDCLIHGSGYQTRDFMYVSDTVDGIITAYEKHDKLALYPIVNICTGKETSMNGLYQMCANVCGSEGVNVRGILLYDDERPGDIRKMVGDPWYAKESIKWKYKVSLDEGLRKYLHWLKERMK